MTAIEFANWLEAHGHDDVTLHDDPDSESDAARFVTSTYNGKRRRYELVPAVLSAEASLFGGDIERGPYWKRIAP